MDEGKSIRMQAIIRTIHKKCLLKCLFSTDGWSLPCRVSLIAKTVVSGTQTLLVSKIKQAIEKCGVKLRACSDQQKYCTLVYRAWVALIKPETSGRRVKKTDRQRERGGENINHLGESQQSLTAANKRKSTSTGKAAAHEHLQYLSRAISPHLNYSSIYLSRIYSLKLHNKTSNRQENGIGMKSAFTTVK